MQLRPYQTESVNQIENAFKDHQKVLFESKTGSGKTIIAKFIIEKLINQSLTVLFTANRRLLIDQTADKFNDMSKHISIIMGKDKKKTPKYFPERQLQIGTLQSLVNRKDEINPDYIIFDEVHYGYKGSMIGNLLKAFPNAKILGMSATPISDKGYLLDGFDKYIKSKTKKELIKLEFLCETVSYITVEYDLSDVEITSIGDYNNEQLEKKVNKISLMSNLVDEWYMKAFGRKTVVFCVNIKHAESMKEEFLELVSNVIIIHSKMKVKDIKNNVEIFIETKDCVMINVDMFTTGNDVSDISCIIIARPTKILRFYEQMIGRGSRIHKGKENCIFIDAGNCIEEFGMPDEDRKYELEPIYNEKLDKKLEIKREYGKNDSNPEKSIAKKLVKIHTLADVYSNKVYSKESEFQADVRKILSKFSEIINWRQNSGKLEVIKKDDFGNVKRDRFGRVNKTWVMFTSLPGLPDLSCLFLNSVYFGLELKNVKLKRLPSNTYLRNVFTKNQKKTLSMFFKNNVLFFVIKDCMELFDLILWLQKKIRKVGKDTIIEDGIMEIQDKFYFNLDRLKISWERL